MIKTQTVAVCDICGATEPAAEGECWRNERSYKAPAGWKTSASNPSVHFCPACAALCVGRLKEAKQ